jgi:uncharacterized protein
MTRDDVLDRLRGLEPRLRGLGIDGLYLYGSYARDEAQPDSDIDVLVDFRPDVKLGLVSYMDPYLVLESAFPGIEIGYSTREGLVDCYRPYIEPSLVRVF